MRTVLRFCGLPFRVIRRSATFFAVLALVASLAFNVATLTITGVYAAASGALSAVGVTTVAAREAGERMARRKTVQKVGRKTAERVSRRAQRSAARNIASVGGEAIPFVGIAVIAVALAMEIDDACDTAADMAGLEAALTTEDDAEMVRDKTVEEFDCSTLIPDYDDLPDGAAIWTAMISAPHSAWTSSVALYDDLSTSDWKAELAKGADRLAAWTGKMFSYEDLRSWWAEEEEKAK